MKLEIQPNSKIHYKYKKRSPVKIRRSRLGVEFHK